MDGAASQAIHDGLVEHGAVAKYVGPRLGPVQARGRNGIEAEVTLETAPPVLFDAVVLPSGKAAIDALLKNGQAMDFIKNQYRHCKPILALEGASALLEAAGIPPSAAQWRRRSRTAGRQRAGQRDRCRSIR